VRFQHVLGDTSSLGSFPRSRYFRAVLRSIAPLAAATVSDFSFSISDITSLICRSVTIQIPPSQGIRTVQPRRRPGTSVPALHCYESGWDRFEIATLRRIAEALDARLVVRLVPRRGTHAPKVDPRSVTRVLAPLFWEKRLAARDLAAYPDWVLRRALVYGTREQVRAARAFFGDERIRRGIDHRSVDRRTRSFWRLVLEGGSHASEGSEH